MLGHGEISPAGLALISVLLGVSVCGAFSVSPIRSAGGASAPGWRSSRLGGDAAVDLSVEFIACHFGLVIPGCVCGGDVGGLDLR